MRTHHATIYVSSCYYMCPHTTIFELYLSSCYFIDICVLILLYLNTLSLPQVSDTLRRRITTRYKSVSHPYILYAYYICVLILYTTYVSSYAAATYGATAHHHAVQEGRMLTYADVC